MSKQKDRYIDFGENANQVNAADIPCMFTPTSYLPISNTIEEHLKALDTLFAALSPITATPSAVPLIVGGQAGKTRVSWSAPAYPDAVVYLSQNNGPEQVFGVAPSYQNAEAPWIQLGPTYEFRLYSSQAKEKLLSKVQVKGFEYKVGVDYHATGANFDADSFLGMYHNTAVRNLVKTQLKGMADRGATLISTRLWMVMTERWTPGLPTEHWKFHFPPSALELANLRQYAQDVAAIVAADGHRLRLDLTMLRLWAADIERGSPSTTLGYEDLTVEEFTTRWETSYKSIIDAVYDIQRPDGCKVADIVYMDGEVMVGAKVNQDWFLTTFYPDFVSYAQSKGLTPSLYFSVAGTEAEILDNGFMDGDLPALNGHRSMYWVYRSLKFMKDNGLPMPERVDLSTYLTRVSASYDVLAQRVFDDADASLSTLGLKKQYGNAECYYFGAGSDRKALGGAMANQRLINGRLRSTTFWTTPDAGGPGAHFGYPFAIEDYLPTVYRVGVNYHQTGASLDDTAFLNDYHIPATRSLVQSQLQAMANAGAYIISTRIWTVRTGTELAAEKWICHFPLLTQQQANLRQYAQDVASIVASDGHRLRLDLSVLRCWAAQYDIGTTTTTLGYENIPVADWSARTIQSYQQVVDAVSDIVRPDNVKVVDTVYLDGEVMVGAKTNTEWFLSTFWPGFVTYCTNKGVRPSIYFIAGGPEELMFDDNFVDGAYPALKGRRSCFYTYRSLLHLKTNNLPIPDRIDFSFYPTRVITAYADYTRRMFDDADGIMDSLGLPRNYALAEAPYNMSATDRREFGLSLLMQTHRLRHTTFWPMDGTSFPFAVSDFLP